MKGRREGKEGEESCFLGFYGVEGDILCLERGMGRRGFVASFSLAFFLSFFLSVRNYFLFPSVLTEMVI